MIMLIGCGTCIRGRNNIDFEHDRNKPDTTFSGVQQEMQAPQQTGQQVERRLSPAVSDGGGSATKGSSSAQPVVRQRNCFSGSAGCDRGYQQVRRKRSANNGRGQLSEVSKDSVRPQSLPVENNSVPVDQRFIIVTNKHIASWLSGFYANSISEARTKSLLNPKTAMNTMYGATNGRNSLFWIIFLCLVGGSFIFMLLMTFLLSESKEDLLFTASDGQLG